MMILLLNLQSDVEETVTVVKKTTACKICGLIFKGIKIHLATCKKKAEIKRLALLALSELSRKFYVIIYTTLYTFIDLRFIHLFNKAIIV
jgi:hypothetical protein